MESKPNAQDAATALADAEAARTALAEHLEVPPWFYVALGLTIAVQIATFAIGVGGDGRGWVAFAGAGVFVLASAVLLLGLRRTTGVWLGGLVSRVVGGTAPVASTTYGLALGAAVWAGLEEVWWVVALAAVAGGIAYAWSGVAWVRDYRADPAAHSRGESTLVLGLLGGLALAGLALMLVLR